MSPAPNQTRNSQLSPDTPVQGREQGQKPKTKCLNPKRRLVLHLGRELDLRILQGAP